MLYRFNDFVLDTDCFELCKNGISIHVEPQVIELLTLLIDNRDRMVSKEEINEKVWRGRIVSEAALSSRIKSARQALGDNGRTQQVIRTIHKKGFRFVAELESEHCLEKEAETITTRSPINKELEKDKQSRHSRPAIAVLPFENLSSEAEHEYFSDGITSDIITFLSKHRWLDVTARNTTFGYKGKKSTFPNWVESWR